jgi:hypothetical protein
MKYFMGNTFVLGMLSFFLSAQIIFGQTDSVTISEVMFKPVGGGNTNEFVEIYNSGTHAVNLSGWRLRDNISIDTLKNAGFGMILKPGQYGIIFDTNYVIATGAYKNMIPGPALIVKVHDGQVGNGLGDTGDIIKLISLSGDTVSLYAYTAASAFPAGYSFEKIIMNNDNTAGNWVRSLYLNGTPGAPPETDLSIAGLVFNPAQSFAGIRDTVNVLIRNVGISTVGSFKVKLFEDMNLSYSEDAGEQVDSVASSYVLHRNDSVSVSLLTPPLGNGKHVFIASIDGSSITPAADTMLSNNTIMDSVKTAAAMDLALTHLQFSPAVPAAGSTLTIAATIRNVGLTAATSFAVKLFDDVNDNHYAEDSELADSVAFSGNLAAGDSAVVAMSVHNLTFRRHDYIARIIGATVTPLPDENRGNDVREGLISVAVKPQSVVINEINYHPSAAGSAEWIELFNCSTDTLDLKKWKIADEANFNSPKTVTANSYRMRPGEFVIIGKDSALFNTKFPNTAAAKFFLNSAMPTLNDGGDQIVLFDSLNGVVDSLFYDPGWGGGLDLSLERKETSAHSYDAANWSSCLFRAGATPGALNSVTPVDCDVAITQKDISFVPAHPAAGEQVAISALIRNKGLRSVATSFTVKFYCDASGDGIGQMIELIDSSVIYALAAGDSVAVMKSWLVPLSLSKHHRSLSATKLILVQIEWAQDERMDNNTAVQELKTGTRSHSLVISELLYNPDSTQTEFVEVYNRTSTAVNVKNWKIADASTSRTIATGDLIILPECFHVLVPDSSFFNKFSYVPAAAVTVIPSLPSLNNDQDVVVLSDDVGTIIDSVYYFSVWGGARGVSLERIHLDAEANDPANWTSCIAASRATPGGTNSIVSAHPFKRSDLVINEIMFSPLANEPEYVELFNASDQAINILNWSVQVGFTKVFLTTADYFLEAKGYVLVAQDKKLSGRFDLPASRIVIPYDWPALPNTGAPVILRDWVGVVIDSLNYLPSWGGGEGISLERKKPDGDGNSAANWSSCVFPEGGTPGKVNSIFTSALSAKIRISADPNPFFADQKEQTKIIVELPVAQAHVTMKIFDNQGRLIHTLLNNSPSGSHREILWDGRDRGGNVARMGIYIIYVEAIDEMSGYSKSSKRTVVLGKKL